MVLQRLFAAAVLTLVGLAAYSNGQLLEYPALRIFGPSVAIVPGVNTADDCKGHLIANQYDLDAVSFDSRNRNCTSVSKYFSYYFAYDVDWTTFKVAASATTNKIQTASNAQQNSTFANNTTKISTGKPSSFNNGTAGYQTSQNYYNNGTQGYQTTQNYYNNGTQGYQTTQNYYNNGTQGYQTTQNYYNNGTQGYQTSQNYNNGTQGYQTTQNYNTSGTQGYQTTQGYYSTTGSRNSSAVIGVCGGSGYLHLEPEQELKLSVYSADFDLCASFPNGASYYQTNMRCSYRIESHDIEGYEFKVSYDLHYGDSLTLIDGNAWYRYTGLDGAAENALRGQYAQIEFSSDNAWVGRGFCLTIKAKTRLNSATASPQPNATASTSEPAQTYGVCHGSRYVTIGEAGLFTFESYSPSACSAFPSSSYYYNSLSDCSVEVDSFYDTIGYQYVISYETEECCDYIGLSNNSQGNGEIQFRGSATKSGYLPGRNARISFFSDFSAEERGFCLQLTPVRQPIYTTPSAPNATQNVDNQTKTIGLCSDNSDQKLEFGEVASFAVYSYEFDLCPGFPSYATAYQNNQFCSHEIGNSEAEGFEFSLKLDLASGDRLDIMSQEARLSFTNRSDTITQFIRGQNVVITFSSDSKDVGKGFCLKITPRNAQVSFSAPAIASTSAPQSSQTLGVCDYFIEDYNVRFNQSVALSSDSRDYNCANRQVYAFLTPNTYCSLKFQHPANSTGLWKLQLVTPSNVQYTKLLAASRSELSRVINLVSATTYYFTASTLEIIWTTEPYLEKGVYPAFCLNVEPY